MSILSNSNILFAHISPSVKVLSTTDHASFPEVSAPLQEVDFRGMVFANSTGPPCQDSQSLPNFLRLYGVISQTTPQPPGKQLTPVLPPDEVVP